jgi:ribosome-associated heat shock protein Hsp15
VTGDAHSVATLRLDKWLWHARFFKSRSRAAAFVAEGRLRLNRRHVGRPSAAVRAGDVLTFPLGSAIRVVRVLALGARRGPPAEASQLFEDLAPAEEPRRAADAPPRELHR